MWPPVGWASGPWTNVVERWIGGVTSKVGGSGSAPACAASVSKRMGPPRRAPCYFLREVAASRPARIVHADRDLRRATSRECGFVIECVVDPPLRKMAYSLWNLSPHGRVVGRRKETNVR